MKKLTTFLTVFGLAFLIVGFTGPVTAFAEVESNDETVLRRVADVNIGPHGINWLPKVEYARLLLTVSGPDGADFSKNFEAGSSPYLESSAQLPDGPYTYELRVIPVTGKKIRKAHETAGMAQAGVPSQETLVQTGYFLIKGGRFVTPQAPETGIAKPLDIVHADDVIIDGSLCVGNDCYNGLAFGFDTIVLMENNLRIFFDDTSTIQNYPRNDWRIICNDSTDSGGNYFAIEDATEVSNILVLEAGAPDNSLYVDSHGDVGINTSTPYYELHIVDGDSPCVRLDQDGSYGWTPQKWDLCGNESNFFIRDATHASKLPFRIEPEAPTDSIFIKSNGYVGLGTGSPAYPLELEVTGATAVFALQRTDGATAKIVGGSNAVQFGSISNHNVKIIGNDSTTLATFETGGDVGLGTGNPIYKLQVWNDAGTGYGYSNGGAWATGSKRAFKENIKELNAKEAMSAFLELNPIRFNYKGDNEKEEQLGFIAEDVPEIVATQNRDAITAMDIATLLTKVVQQQQKSMQEQQKTITELMDRIAALEKK
jgi:hypothetical protein